MDYTFTWLDDDNTILICICVGEFNWQSIASVATDGDGLVGASPYLAGIVVDFSQVWGVPGDVPLYVESMIDLINVQAYQVILVAHQDDVREMFFALMNAYPQLAPCWSVVYTFNEALELLGM
jgi:hypothetical protein